LKAASSGAAYAQLGATLSASFVRIQHSVTALLCLLTVCVRDCVFSVFGSSVIMDSGNGGGGGGGGGSGGGGSGKGKGGGSGGGGGKGKGGKGQEKTRSRSARAGLQFPVGRVLRKMRQMKPWGIERYGVGAAVYMASTLEYLAAEVLELAGNAARASKRKRIINFDINAAVRNDDELRKFFQYELHATIAESGVPRVHINDFLKPGGNLRGAAKRRWDAKHGKKEQAEQASGAAAKKEPAEKKKEKKEKPAEKKNAEENESENEEE
jgi:histone H2A